jgi:hypothetical protein
MFNDSADRYSSILFDKMTVVWVFAVFIDRIVSFFLADQNRNLYGPKMVCGPDFGNHCTRPWLFPSILDLKISFDYQIIILTNFFVSKRPAQIKRFVRSECWCRGAGVFKKAFHDSSERSWAWAKMFLT